MAPSSSDHLFFHYSLSRGSRIKPLGGVNFSLEISEDPIKPVTDFADFAQESSEEEKVGKKKSKHSLVGMWMAQEKKLSN